MEKKKKSYLSKAVFGLLIVAFTVCCIIAAPITEAKGTLWSLFPPVIAIGLALITKEVYSSLFVGILSGGIIYAAASGTGFEGTFKAAAHIKGRRGAALSTFFLGVLIFVDDYFNCLTVGSVMRPITDKHNISRSKLAYLIDSTAAPICIIAPISSWAAAVSGTVEGVNGISLFINTIPYNLYAF